MESSAAPSPLKIHSAFQFAGTRYRNVGEVRKKVDDRTASKPKLFYGHGTPRCEKDGIKLWKNIWNLSPKRIKCELREFTVSICRYKTSYDNGNEILFPNAKCENTYLLLKAKHKRLPKKRRKKCSSPSFRFHIVNLFYTDCSHLMN